MNCAIVIRGAHYNYEKTKIDYKPCFLNHTKNIFDSLKMKDIHFDIYLLTYESPIIKDLLDDYKPCKTYILNEAELVHGGTWHRQNVWHTQSVKLLKMAEKEKGVQYDFVLNTRFDIEFPRPLFEYDLDLKKINVMYKHLSGNCDDNFFFLPRNLLDTFESVFQTLLSQHRITHEFCRFIPDTLIHYLFTLPNDNKGAYSEILRNAFILTRTR